ncbi:DUF3772 domain-containing protein [Sphingomonas sp. PL-96]|uniref:DUF3772 domain-containing protein n=1 Tax=Sphingomonas sp. PL-96 TaxID=2887201 RepID=UPI001E3DE2D0|nr:DUF3772 domain-containing protein [Sphingomonas sp. PL-96]MCC2978281.1 DUF3772 domain-containing protein [Sphingomonas sp. PL-96]
MHVTNLIRRMCWLMLLAAVAAPSPPALAQDTPVLTANRQLAQAEQDVRGVDRALDVRVDADERRGLRTRILAARATVALAASQLSKQLALVDARLSGLGDAAADEAPDIARQRRQLRLQRSAIDAAVKRAGLADVEASQLAEELDRSEAEQFAQTVAAKVVSPITPAFWRSVFRSVPRDLRRIEMFASQGARQIRAQVDAGFPWAAMCGVLFAVALLFPGRQWLARLGQRYLIEGAPGHRVRRSAYAVWRVLLGTLSPLLAAFAVVQGLRWSGLAPVRWDDLLNVAMAAFGFGGFTAAITGAVLMRSQPSWRLAPIDDEVANRLRPLSWMLAGLGAAWLLVNGFNDAVGASQPARVVTQAVMALLYLLLIGTFLLALGRIRTDRSRQDDGDASTTRAGLGLLELAAWMAVGVALLALLSGYIGLAFTIVQFLSWATVLGAATYLLGKASDDILTSVFTRESHLGRTLTRGLGLRGSAVDQFGLILSGGTRLVILVLAIGALLSPFGGSGGLSSMFGRLGTLSQGIEIGEVSVSPGTILRGAVVLLVGLALMRAFMRWLDTRYLPVTDLDGSARNSVSLVSRYIGVALAIIWALASLGVGVERLALLLSALSVGIGFGLQAITQNFVSGLILLAERPIKIGDLIRVGADEGDVKRINVRSTEIELDDHSTLIVPNSELITKPVLNKTLTSPLGRVQIKFSVPIEADPAKVKRILLQAFAEEDAILTDPAPSVFVDSIADGRILFNSFAHVTGPRAVYGARSGVLLVLLHRLQHEGVVVGTVS